MVKIAGFSAHGNKQAPPKCFNAEKLGIPGMAGLP